LGIVSLGMSIFGRVNVLGAILTIGATTGGAGVMFTLGIGGPPSSDDEGGSGGATGLVGSLIPAKTAVSSGAGGAGKITR